MGKIKKKGTSGQAKNFITRTQAVRKLQISLPDFRRLCIFKGIYPREPRNKKKASKSSTASTTFYYTKDIQYLLHEPVLRKFREHKAFAKKLSRALGRGDVSTAARLEKTAKPNITLDHIVKERYPTFIDALRDLDDALSMLFLFANLPSTLTVPPKTIALCERLCLEFEHYLITSHSLRKSFLSIKGIYYQATIQGQDILWLVPYKFAQKVTGDVDFRIMGTFVEFYATLLGFVNFRLYTSIGLVYPPKFDRKSDECGGELGAFTLEGRGVGGTLASTTQTNGSADSSSAMSGSIQQKQLDSISGRIASLPTPSSMEAEHEPEPANVGATPPSPGEPSTELMPIDTIDTFEPPIAADADALDQPDFMANDGLASLFAPFTFYLSRETPRQPLEFLLRSFGCKRIGWDTVLGDGAFTNNEADPSITHQIVDRPPLPLASLPPVPEAITEDEISSTSVRPGSRIPGRTYVQPQWVWDCANAGKLLRPDLYAPGATLPPHLSPWVKPGKREYDPTAPLAEQERDGEGEGVDSEESDEDVEGDEGMGKIAPRMDNGNGETAHGDVEAGEGMDIAGSESSEDEEDRDEYHDQEWDGFDDDAESESEAEASRSQHQRELEAEAAGLPFSTAVGTQEMTDVKKSREDARKKAARKRREEEEELERAKMMMSRKKRKLLDKMLYSNRRKDEEAETLRRKRRKIERKGV